MVRALEAETDRDIARRHVNDAARDEERADTPWALLVQGHRGVVDGADAADPRADQNAGAFAFLVGLGFGPGVGDGLRCGRHAVDDERINLALLLHIHPFVGIEFAIRIVAKRHAAGDLAGNVIDLKIVDALGAALAREQVRPGGFDPAAQWTDDAYPGDDDAAALHAPKFHC